MKLEEAIKQGIDSVGDSINLYVQVDKRTLELLIEAGKREMDCRAGRTLSRISLLPGETLE